MQMIKRKILLPLIDRMKDPVRYWVKEREKAKREREKASHSNLLSINEGAELIKGFLENNSSFAAGKIGLTELTALNIWQDETVSEKRWKKLVSEERYYGGIYPVNDNIYSKFCEIYSSALNDMDLLALWFLQGEARALRKFSPKTKKTVIKAITPHKLEKSWTSSLVGKTVLVVSPFEKTIKQQYEKRLDIWQGKPEMLPEFNLKTLRIQQNAALLEMPEFKNWVEGYECYKEKIAEIEFDVALIGAGAWSIPLAAEAKRLGKSAVHLGGDNQLLFGIMGGRWRNNPEMQEIFNDHWTDVLPEEIPRQNRVSKVPSFDQYW